MAGRWLLYVGFALAVGMGALLTLAGVALVGLFLATVIWLAVRAAVDPVERALAERELRRQCDRLPFCDCGDGAGRPTT